MEVVGGTGPSTYEWSPGSQTSDRLENLAAGNYFVTVTDANNCTQSLGPLTVSEPPFPSPSPPWTLRRAKWCSHYYCAGRVSFFFVYFLMPETKGKTLEEVTDVRFLVSRGEKLGPKC